MSLKYILSTSRSTDECVGKCTHLTVFIVPSNETGETESCKVLKVQPRIDYAKRLLLSTLCKETLLLNVLFSKRHVL